MPFTISSDVFANDDIQLTVNESDELVIENRVTGNTFSVDSDAAASDIGAQSPTGFVSTAGLSQWGNQFFDSQRSLAYLPQFEKKADPILTSEMTDYPTGTLNVPSVIRVGHILDNPLGEYYLYTSGHNHDGIGLATADDPRGTWTWQGIVYDTLQVRENDVVYDPINQEFRLYANTQNQSHRMLVSQDGQTWTPWNDDEGGEGLIFETSGGHPGYPRVYRTGAGWYISGFMKFNEDESLSTLRFSEDGKTDWRWMELAVGNRDDLTGEASGNGAMMNYTYTPFQNGYLVIYQEVMSSETNIRIRAGYTEDGINITDYGVIMEPSLSWEDTRIGNHSLFWEGDLLHMVYAGGDFSGHFSSYGIATADFSEVGA